MRFVSGTGGLVLRGSRHLTWVTRGPWVVGDTVALEYSADGGTSWSSIPGAGAIPFELGFDWNVAALSPGTNYLLRLTRNGGGVTVTSAAFRVISPEIGRASCR